MKLLFFGLLLVNLSFAGPREDAAVLLESVSGVTSVGQRLEILSKVFLGLPYGKGGPLGEGVNGRYDQDPLYRFDTFDCTTYVETLMALSLSKTVEEFESHIDRIRYENGHVDYLKRNHFTDMQWIPWTISAGYLRESTHLISGNVLVAEALISFGGWLRSHKLEQIVVPLASAAEKETLLEELKTSSHNYPDQVARVPYISIKSILSTPRILSRMKNGMVVNFVRPNWDLTDVAGTRQNISHQGFLFVKGRRVYLRHASTTGSVQEVLFVDYLKKFENHPTLKGVHFMEMNSVSI